MSRSPHPGFSRRIKPSQRWVFIGLTLLAIFLLVASLQPGIIDSPISRVLFMLAGLGLAGVIGVAYRNIELENKRLAEDKQASDANAASATQRLEAVFKLGKEIVEARDESEVVAQVLDISMDLVGAAGASFVPIDERGQPLAAIRQGDTSGPGMDAWVEYLASPAVRHQCTTCRDLGSAIDACPLLDHPRIGGLPGVAPTGIYCLPLRRGDREYGILNIYLPKDRRLDDQTQVFLRALIEETSLALEGIRLRRRELAAFRQLQDVRLSHDLESLLSNFLQNICETLKADSAILRIWEGQGYQKAITLLQGDLPQPALVFIENILSGQQSAPMPIVIGEVSNDSPGSRDIRSLMVVPLAPQDGLVIGAIACGAVRPGSFTHRQLLLLQTLASQAALVVHNNQLMAELEYKTLMGERTRLAREIHDGLAQTLGFLKLLTSQMQAYLANGDRSHLEEGLQTSYKILADTYLDARQAIDGLRITANGESLASWLEQTVEEFTENTGIPVQVEVMDGAGNLPPEIQAQLMRILQESLSNIRKHSGASQAWVTCAEGDGDLILEVRDNGAGFLPEDVPSISRYGLQGMRERSELIGGDFQIISSPEQGTTVRLRLPLHKEEV